ncbi:hypothetical protein NLM27_41780 [Bradyrhizobium sp. CCGB12]|uniref:hypothetical protein n=1 Tax=Bradyrhizobium sp. CCGB12 TaxID=2949632 RepID=UPI0020B29868|nr:hypothetical protein [Bradyrhizobium sp. CCGB12]MCP3395265.1 hypothetical protein [Bradyrhizobium sp. CCGB12]
MRAGFRNPGSLYQPLAFRSGGQLSGLFFELIGQFGHSFFKGAGSASLLGGAASSIALRYIFTISPTEHGNVGSKERNCADGASRSKPARVSSLRQRDPIGRKLLPV